MTTVTVVLALVDSHLDATPGTAPFSIGALPVWARLRDAIEQGGFSFQALRDGLPAAGKVIVLWDFASLPRLPSDLAARADGRVVAWTLESPLVAHRSFHRIESIVRSAQETLAFPGTQMLLPPEMEITPLYWPIHRKPVVTAPLWRDRKGVVLIASSKGVRPRLSSLDIQHPYLSARRVASSLVAVSYAFRRAWTVPDLYEERAATAAFLAQSQDTAIYGPGWKRFRGPNTVQELIRARYRGMAHNKEETLKKYKFCICFENTRFPGYITEKIFDCFFAGTIPIYLGAPDVAEYIPPDSFVDASKIKRDELGDLVSSLTDVEASRYLDAAAVFLGSPHFDTFSEETFIRTMTNAVERAAA